MHSTCPNDSYLTPRACVILSHMHINFDSFFLNHEHYCKWPVMSATMKLCTGYNLIYSHNDNQNRQCANESYQIITPASANTSKL